MEFNEKLQRLRKEKGLTQEELSQTLFVSRAAVSKWESGRGYPNIESLKRLSEVFVISIDDLLSGEELIVLAQEENQQNRMDTLFLQFGLLDLMNILFVFIPLFGERRGQIIHSVPLIFVQNMETYMIVAYYVVLIFGALYGILEVALRKSQSKYWLLYNTKLTFGLSICSTIVFIVSQQPYIAFLMLWILISKGILLLKKQ